MRTNEMQNIDKLVVSRSDLKQIVQIRQSENMFLVYIFLHAIVEHRVAPLVGVAFQYNLKTLFRKFNSWTDYRKTISFQQFSYAFKKLETEGFIQVSRGENEFFIFLCSKKHEKDVYLNYIYKEKEKFFESKQRYTTFWTEHGYQDVNNVDKILLSSKLQKNLAEKNSDQKVVKI